MGVRRNLSVSPVMVSVYSAEQCRSHERFLTYVKLSHFFLCGLLGLTHAVPTPTQPQNDAEELERRGLISGAINSLNQDLTGGANDISELADNILTRLDE